LASRGEAGDGLLAALGLAREHLDGHTLLELEMDRLEDEAPSHLHRGPAPPGIPGDGLSKLMLMVRRTCGVTAPSPASTEIAQWPEQQAGVPCGWQG